MKLEAVIGLEVHVQLNTRSKIFSSDRNAFGEKANTVVSPVSLGYPGTLPKLNKEALNKAIMIGLACNCTINKTFRFARKHYFYPDLPKGYQITQFDNPICTGGYLEFDTPEGRRKIRLDKIHLEEDAGKSIHDAIDNYTVVDLNRSGVPLIEMVTEPDLRSADDAYKCLHEVRTLVRHLEISDGDMEKGSLRCDANVSVREYGNKELGRKVEIKNLNSMRFVKKALEYEIARQVALLENGDRIETQTRAYNERENRTFAIRSKEMEHDYRYFPDPDLPPFTISENLIREIRELLPLSANEIQQLLSQKYGLSEMHIESLLADKDMLTYFRNAAKYANDYKMLMNWLSGPVKAFLNENDMETDRFPVEPEHLAELINMISEGDINFNIAVKHLFPEMVGRPGISARQLKEELNLVPETGVGYIQQLVLQVVDKYPGKVEEFRNGKKGIIEMFMGEVMKSSRGKADPVICRKIIIEILNSKNK